MTRVWLAAAAALSLSACAVTVDESTLIHPVKAGALDPSTLGGNAARYTAEQHWITRADGARLHAVLLRQPGAKATILYFGGNGFAIGRHGAWTASLFAPLGADLMMVDHRGYGLSTGTPTIAAGEADGLAAFDYLTKLRAGPILVHGHSMGSFIAGHVAVNRDTAAAILESSATTTEEWVGSRMGGLAGKVARVRIADALKGRGNAQNIVQIDEPLLILVGGKDKTTPPILSQRLYDASPLPLHRKSFVLVPEAGHNDVMRGRLTHAAYKRLLDSVTGS